MTKASAKYFMKVSLVKLQLPPADRAEAVGGPKPVAAFDTIAGWMNHAWLRLHGNGYPQQERDNDWWYARIGIESNRHEPLTGGWSFHCAAFERPRWFGDTIHGPH